MTSNLMCALLLRPQVTLPGTVNTTNAVCIQITTSEVTAVFLLDIRAAGFKNH